MATRGLPRISAVVIERIGSVGRIRTRRFRTVTLAMALVLCATAIGLAADFFCEDVGVGSGVPCLINAINAANRTVEADTITLTVFYPVTAVDNNTDGPNGLPSITSEITIKSDGGAQIERRDLPPGSLPDFRIFHVAATGKLTLNNVNLIGGSLSSGNGACILNAGGTVHIIDSVIQDNEASMLAVGGGIFNDTGGTLTITRSFVLHNSSGVAPGGSGGLVNKGVATITRSDITQNTGFGIGASNGGIRNTGGTLHITNSTIARNIANEQSGAGVLNEGGGSVTIANSTIAENDAPLTLSLGGGISNDNGTVELRNSILVENKGLDQNSAETISNCSGAITSLGNNVIGISKVADGCVINAVGSDIRNIDAGVLDQFTEDLFGHFPLLPGSPAIDAGNPATPGSGGGACEATDQLGFPRPADGDLDGTPICDIGSIEFPRPGITGFSPTFGQVGTSVVVMGAGFTGTTLVTFGGVSANFGVDSPTQITATVPEGAITGPIAVTTPQWTLVSASTFTAPPTITGFSPPGGPTGASVVITGTNFIGASSVSFVFDRHECCGDIRVNAAFHVDSETQITATVPDAITGPIAVNNPAGGLVGALSASAFTVIGPTITGFSPPGGPVGTRVVISGTSLIGAAYVTFQGTFPHDVAFASFTVDSSTQITATVPIGATTGPIALSTRHGAAVSATFFTVPGTVAAPPSITGFLPPRGPVGTSVVISGTDLSGASSITFHGTFATFTVNSPTQITATVPAGATTGPIAVTTPAGTATTTAVYTVANVVNGLVALAPLVVSRSDSPVPGGPAGTMTIRATFTNTSSTPIDAPFFQVTQLSGGNLLLNADGAPGGVGATLTPDVGVDRVLTPGESFTAEFDIGLQARTGFSFFVNLLVETSP